MQVCTSRYLGREKIWEKNNHVSLPVEATPRGISIDDDGGIYAFFTYDIDAMKETDFILRVTQDGYYPPERAIYVGSDTGGSGPLHVWLLPATTEPWR